MTGSPEPRGKLDRFLLSFMGPAQIGDPRAPLTYEPEASSSLCEKCGKPYDLHERVYSNVTYLTCPAA